MSSSVLFNDHLMVLLAWKEKDESGLACHKNLLLIVVQI